MTGCAGPTKLDPPPANLVIECETAPLIAPGANMGDLLLSDIELAGLYAECRRRHKGLAEWAEAVTRPK